MNKFQKYLCKRAKEEMKRSKMSTSFLAERRVCRTYADVRIYSDLCMRM